MDRIEELAATLRHYFDGIYTGDVEMLRRVLHPDIRLVCRRDGLIIDRDDYLAAVASRASPADRGDPRFDEVQSLSSATATTAHARVTLAYLPKRFTDELVLVREDDHWQVIAKVWDYVVDEAGPST